LDLSIIYLIKKFNVGDLEVILIIIYAINIARPSWIIHDFTPNNLVLKLTYFRHIDKIEFKRSA